MTYEIPDLLEVGAVRDKVLGIGTTPDDRPNEGSKLPLSILDID